MYLRQQLHILELVLVKVLDKPLDFGSLQQTNHFDTVAHKNFAIARQLSNQRLLDVIGVSWLQNVPQQLPLLSIGDVASSRVRAVDCLKTHLEGLIKFIWRTAYPEPSTPFGWQSYLPKTLDNTILSSLVQLKYGNSQTT